MCTLLNMNLTSSTPRKIIPRLKDSVFRLGATHPACTPNSESSISRSKGYFQDYAALPYFPPNEDQPISLCLVRPWNLLDLHGLVFYFILIIFEALHFILFLSPPHPRRGDLCHHWQAFHGWNIISTIFTLESCFVKNLVRKSEQASSYHVRHEVNR